MLADGLGLMLLTRILLLSELIFMPYSAAVSSSLCGMLEDIIICDSLHSFKSRLDKFLKGRGFI